MRAVEVLPESARYLSYGQFAGERMSTEEDFSTAEWRDTPVSWAERPRETGADHIRVARAWWPVRAGPSCWVPGPELVLRPSTLSSG